ncbi:MAG TPA: hypothetical protein VI111_06725 [Thermoleophilaceae bacterium]
MNDKDRPLPGNRAVLTGASNGLGGAYCGRLLSLGVDVSSIWGANEVGSACDQDGWSAADLQRSIDRIAAGDLTVGEIVWN